VPARQTNYFADDRTRNRKGISADLSEAIGRTLIEKHPMIINELRFHADLVTAVEEEYTSDYTVHGIYFGEGDPEQSGQHWNFTRSLDDDDGVCIVKEIQEVVVYGGITGCILTRHFLTCDFDDETAQETLTHKLHITFEINDETWQAIQKQALLVFAGEGYFQLIV
jgi:hypothetical protein